MYQDRIDAATRVIEDHNKNVPEGAAISPGIAINNIKLSGGTSEDRLKSLSHEDILAALADALPNHGANQIKPIGVAKEIAKLFRGTETATASDYGPPRVTPRRAESMSREELIAAYDINDPENPVGKRLKELSKGMPFLVLDTANRVLVKESQHLLDEIQQGFGSRDIYQVGTVFLPTLRVGDKPELQVDADPLYPDRPLRPDGTSDQLNRSWNGVSYDVRSLIYLALLEGELLVNHQVAHSTLDVALQSDAFARLSAYYPKAAALWTAKNKSNDLPRLKIVLKNNKLGSPLAKGTKVN